MNNTAQSAYSSSRAKRSDVEGSIKKFFPYRSFDFAYASLRTTRGHLLISGFTFVELMISIAILTLISTATVFSLNASRNREELNVAARTLSADIRNMQARALAARNVSVCDTAAGNKKVCETGNASPIICAGPCTPLPPSHVGLFFQTTHTDYALFADVSDDDWRDTGNVEDFLTRSLNPRGGTHVSIDKLETELGVLQTLNIAAGRQNGLMRVNACGDSGLPACSPTEPQIARITLRHSLSNDTVVIEVNALTGRVSIE